ncbi:MAG: hypothetical protein AB1597_00400 [Chloroflexota bacterium]
MEKIGEVIEARTGQFLAQCYRLHEAPPLGCLVKTRSGSTDIYGVVASASTHSLDPGRRVIARGEHESTDDAVFTTNPQLARLLITDFTVIITGHKSDGVMRHYLPPHPARIHAFVNICPSEEAKEFAISLDFIDLIVAAERDFAVDEIVAACLRRLATIQADPQDFLVRAGKHLTVLMFEEFQRLNSILKRLK